MMFPIYQKYILHKQKSTLGWIPSFPDARVWGKHSAWMSTAPNRAEARTHYPQRNGAHISLPPGGRWHAKRDGRSLRDFKFSQFSWYRALPHPTSSGAPSRREPFRIVPPIEKHHQRKFLGGVSYFSAKVAELTARDFLYNDT